MLLCFFGKVPLFQFKHIRHYLFIAVIGVTLPNLAYYYAAPFLSAGILSITVSTIPVLTYGLMVLLRFESVVIKRVMGIALGMIAILFKFKQFLKTVLMINSTLVYSYLHLGT